MQSVSPLRIVVPMVVHSPTKAKVNVNDEGVAGGTSISRPSLHQEQCTELASGPYRWCLAPHQANQGVLLAGTNGLHGWYSEYQDDQRWMGASIKMNRTNNGWNGCNLFKSYMKYRSTAADEPLLPLIEYVRLHLCTAKSYRRRHSPSSHGPTMCTDGCKPPELDLLKGEGSNLQKTGEHLLSEWKNELTQADRDMYNNAARLITRAPRKGRQGVAPDAIAEMEGGEEVDSVGAAIEEDQSLPDEVDGNDQDGAPGAARPDTDRIVGDREEEEDELKASKNGKVRAEKAAEEQRLAEEAAAAE